MRLVLLAMLALSIALPVGAPAQQKPPAQQTPPVQQKPPAQPTAQPPARNKPPAQPRPRPAAPSPTAATTATITVADRSGTPIPDVHVMLTGGLERSGSTQTNGIVRFDGLRPGSFRLQLTKDGFTPLEREFEWRAGQPPPNLSVTLAPAPKPAAPPPAPDPPKKAASMPPAGKPMSVSLPDFIEKNYITNSQPQKVSPVACSGVAENVLWQIREPWENRQHPGTDVMIYVIGGEGTLRLDGRDVALQAGHFASLPRGSTYSLVRRGRNPLIVLATLVGEPCQQ